MTQVFAVFDGEGDGGRRSFLRCYGRWVTVGFCRGGETVGVGEWILFCCEFWGFSFDGGVGWMGIPQLEVFFLGRERDWEAVPAANRIIRR